MAFIIHSWLSRLITARGSSLVTIGPAKVNPCKSNQFTEGIPEVEIKFLFSQNQ